MLRRKKFRISLPSGKLVLGERTLIMGVLNVTPDSFSDGGKFFPLNRAVDAAFEMERAGADILDIGAESTRPGSAGITAAACRRRKIHRWVAGAAQGTYFRGHAKSECRGNCGRCGRADAERRFRPQE